MTAKRMPRLFWYNLSMSAKRLIRLNGFGQEILLCTACKKDQLLSEFNRNKNSYCGYSSYCKRCSKDPQLKEILVQNRLAAEAIKIISKLCPNCNTIKSIDSFYNEKSRKDGKQVYCKECLTEKNKIFAKTEAGIKVRAKINRKQRYGITEDLFNDLLKSQAYTCAICSNSNATYIDHDHGCCTGNNGCSKCLRGILCQSCNTGLGKFKDSILLLETAIWYLQKEHPFIPPIESPKFHWQDEVSLYESNKDLIKKYNINLLQYDYLLKQQNHCCAICGDTPENQPYNKLKVDHDHKINIVRGLLCTICNFGLGDFKDDIVRLETAVNYLNLYRVKELL